MRVLLALVVMFGLGACSTAASGAGATSDPAVLAAGRQIAASQCAACHAIDVIGVSLHPEAPPLRELSRNYPVSALEESLAEGIMVGHPDMPEFRFMPEDVAALIAYLESVQDKR